MEMKELLKKIRKKRNLSAQQVADGCSMTLGVYKKYETGERGVGVPALIKLAEFYGVTTDFLLGREKLPDLDPITQFIQEMGLSGYEEVLVRVFFALPQKQRRQFVEDFCKTADEILEKNNQRDTVSETAVAKEDNVIYIDPVRIRKANIKASAGFGTLVFDGGTKWIKVEGAEYPNVEYVIDIQGDSMEPYLHDGELAYVQESLQPQDEDVGIFFYNGNVYIKQLVVEDSGNYILHSFNDELNPDGTEKYPDILISDLENCKSWGKVLNKIKR